MQFLIDDPGGSGTINVIVEAWRGSTTLGNTTAVVTEIGTSGIFELFVTTSNASVDPADPLAATPVDAHVVRINTDPVTNANDAAIVLDDADGQLSNGDTIVVRRTGEEKTVIFGRSNADLVADRNTAGDGNEIILRLSDIDANTDPTATDTFPADAGILSGAGLTQTGSWVETGGNTGIFELTVDVNTPLGTYVTRTLPTSQAFTITDHDVYEAISGAISPYSTRVPTDDTSSTSVMLQNSDGIITLLQPTSIPNGLQLQITDPDRNISTQNDDSLVAGKVTVTVDGEAGAVSNITFEETDDNTGIFIADLPDPIPIGVGFSDMVGPASIILQAETIADDRDIVITYYDDAGDSNLPESITLFTAVPHEKGTLDGPFATSAGDLITLTLSDPDLNFDPGTIEEYSITFPPFEMTQPVAFANGTAMFDLKVRGESFTMGAEPLTIYFFETGSDTGVFVADDMDPSPIFDSVSTSYGDQIKFKYLDMMERTDQEDSAIVFVGGRILSDPDMTAPNMVYAGETIGLTIADRDADFDSEYDDSVNVTVTSDSDPTGIVLSGSETSPNSGVFTLTIPTSTGTLPGAITVEPGDIVYLSYSDIYPAGNTADFVSTVGIGALPDAPIISLPLDGSTMNTPNFEMAGTAPAGSTVRIFEDGGQALIATTVAAANGSWSIESPDFSDGDYSIFAIAYEFDRFSGVEESPPSNLVTFTIDTAIPLQPFITSPEEGELINDSTPTIRGDLQGSSRVLILIDGEGIEKPVSGTEFVYTLGSRLADGPHDVSVIGIDSAGNRSEPSLPVPFTVDTTNPEVVIENPEESQPVNSDSFTISGTASDDTSGVSRIEVSIDGGPFVEATGTTSWSITTSAPEGTYRIAVRAFDLAGNSIIAPPYTIMVGPDIPDEPEEPEDFVKIVIATGAIGGVAAAVSIMAAKGIIKINGKNGSPNHRQDQTPKSTLTVNLYAGFEDTLSRNLYDGTDELKESFENRMSDAKDEFGEKLSMLKEESQFAAEIIKAENNPDAIITEMSNRLLGELLEGAGPITSLFLDDIQAEIKFEGYGRADKQVKANVHVAPKHIKPYVGVKVSAAAAVILDARATFRIETYIDIEELKISRLKKDGKSSTKLNLKNAEFTLRVFVESISYCGKPRVKDVKLKERKFSLNKLSSAATERDAKDVLPKGRGSSADVLPRGQRKCRVCGHIAAAHHNNCGNCGSKLD